MRMRDRKASVPGVSLHSNSPRSVESLSQSVEPKARSLEPMTEEQEVFLKHIQKKGLKRTTQRDLILDIFLRTEDHLSSEDLYRLVKQADPSIGQTTVYRTLKLLTEA